MKVQVYSTKGEKTEEVNLKKDIFGVIPNVFLIAQYIRVYLANQHVGTACTKTRGEVSGGGKKPWKQKGTGRARQGSTRSPIWVHGGVPFGPKPRDFSLKFNNKSKKIALFSALSLKLKSKKVFVLENFSLENLKTKDAFGLLKKIGLGKSALIIVPTKFDTKVYKAFRNIENVKVIRVCDVNAYFVINSDMLVFSRESLAEIEKGVLKK